MPHRLRYFLIVIRCASHQANLAVTSAVTGRAACTAARCARPAALCARQDDDSESPHRTVCGAIVRLFKYMISDYYTDFAANLR